MEKHNRLIIILFLVASVLMTFTGAGWATTGKKHLCVVLAMDTSGSTRSCEKELKGAVYKAIDLLMEGDTVSAVAFDTYPKTLKDADGREVIVQIRDGGERGILREAFRKLKPSGQWTYFRPVIDHSLKLLAGQMKGVDSAPAPVVILVTDGISDPGPGREKDLDPRVLDETFARYPELNDVRFYIVQAAGDSTSALGPSGQIPESRFSRYNIQLFSAKGTHLGRGLSRAIEEIFRGARKPSEVTTKTSLPAAAQAPVDAPKGMPWGKIVLVILLAAVVAAAVWAIRSLKQDPFQVTIEEGQEPRSNMAVLEVSDGDGNQFDQKFPIPPDGRIINVGSDSKKSDMVLPADLGIRPKHFALKFEGDGEAGYRVVKRGRPGKWQELTSEPINLTDDVRLTVSVEEVVEEDFPLNTEEEPSTEPDGKED